MDTDDLIDRLAGDPRPPSRSLSAIWWVALGLAVPIAAAVFFWTLGPRPDFAEALETPRFLFKFLVTITLAASAFPLARTLSRPDEPDRRRIAPVLAAAPALLAGAVIVEIAVLPPELRTARMIGVNSMVCLTYVPLIGLGPLALFIYALRQGAPARPARAGAVAGILAGAIGATFYAAQCPDDSPLFVAVWYSLAIAIVGIVGAAAGHLFARW